jgi:beta-N-acetylhexosaminidase
MPSAAIYGCAGPVLTSDERAFFRDADPLGFILFARNCVDPGQAARLTAALRDSVGRADAPVLIDQEGGRVARMKPPHWRARPPARVFGALYGRDPEAGLEACRLNGRLLAADCAGIGVDVDCIPVLDVPVEGAHDIIGDRAFATDPQAVIALGRAQAEGLAAGGVLPVAKHIPGHGRALADSHVALPIVEASAEQLAREDFATFKALADLPWAMTAHVLYTALEVGQPATLSAKVIREVIRGEIGFDGLLLSDDLTMRALAGTLADRTRASLAAGCDIALHCSGQMREMLAVASGAAAMSADALRRFRAGLGWKNRWQAQADSKSLAEMQHRLDRLLA